MLVMWSMSHARGIVLGIVGLILAGVAAPAHAALSCSAAASIFDTAYKNYAKAAPRPDANPKSETPEDQARNLDETISAQRQRLNDVKAAFGEISDDAAGAHITLAQLLRRAARFQPALEELAAAEGILKTLDPQGRAMAMLLRERGITYSNMRRREAAVAALEAAIALHAQGPAQDSSLEALNSLTLAQVLRGLSRFDASLKALDRARAIYDRNPDANAGNLAEVLIDSYTVLTRLDDKTGALPLIRRAVELSRAKLGPYHWTTARALHNLAIANRSNGDMTASFEALAEAYSIYDTQGNNRRAAEALDEAARSMGRLSCFSEATGYETAARQRLIDQYGPLHVSVADAETRLGTYARDGGNLLAADVNFRTAIGIFDELLGPENVRSAIVARELASVQARKGLRKEAIFTLLGSIRSLQNENVPDELRESLKQMAEMLRQAGNVNGAILFAKKAVNTQQEIRAANRDLSPELSTSLAQRYRDLYLSLADLLIEQGRMEEAQRVIDMIKDQEIIDFVRGGRPKLLSIDSRAPLTKTETKTLAAIDTLLKQPFAVADDLERLVAKSKAGQLTAREQTDLDALKAAFHENFKAFQTEAKALIDALDEQEATIQNEVAQLHLDMLGQARRKLKPFKGRAVLLQIASLKDEVHLFVTGANAQSHRTSPVPRGRLARMAFEGWSATAHASPDADQKLRALYDVLIGPVEQDLKDSGAVVVMLNLEGFLRYIPFAALKGRERYFIEDFALTIQTPAADTQYMTGGRDRARAVGFGVTDALQDFAGLPGVAKELETIFDGSDNAGVLGGVPRLNRDFNADDFATALENRPQFVHIASHFKLEPGDESKSFLLLGTGDELTLETLRTDERFQFMDVDLLTLSACETAGEVGSDGKEVESFATLAQASGASSVMATLWPIADESTATLMADFYRALLDQQLDKAVALQQAQVAMIHARDGAVAMGAPNTVSRGVKAEGEIDTAPAARMPLSHPYYWSAFILMGNWL